MKLNHHFFDEDNHVVDSKGSFKEYLNELFIARCVNCGKKIIWINDDYIYPDIVAKEPNVDMPESVKQLYNEAGTIYNKSPRAACALLRLAIDRLCNELGETDRDINKNIGALVKKGLPQVVQQALDVVRVVGNKAVHPGVISFDVDDKGTVTMLMRLLNIITERMITEPKEIESLYEGLPETVKESITKRDK
ncbi:DUF4145 domain-containing protein [Prevotella sp. OH937_COT-195]|uniref:DUF4145 domain-containing protein n=1 Tax=Prevotella sp. OH937_COT-195 TaxID=2491051 RepID=UPI000F650B03|nr:DUF4145 domain-containing protein [Prevotella sp. OH937_COT-195]RRC96904.1 DUF4145 domain-containing protein [Prevotella sp. OH937_COT-195]